MTDSWLDVFRRDESDGTVVTGGGWRTSPTRMVLVVGPPGSGKTTYVKDHAGPNDVIVDYDVIAAAFGTQVSHSEVLSEAAVAARNAVIDKLRRGDIEAPAAWIVSANPKAETMFPFHELVVVDPGYDETVRRCHAAKRPARWVSLVDDWYRVRKVSS